MRPSNKDGDEKEIHEKSFISWTRPQQSVEGLAGYEIGLKPGNTPARGVKLLECALDLWSVQKTRFVEENGMME